MKVGLPSPNRRLAVVPYRETEAGIEILLNESAGGATLISDVPLNHTALWKEALSLALREGRVKGAIQKRPLSITQGLDADSVVIFALEVREQIGEGVSSHKWTSLSDASKVLPADVYKHLIELPRRSRKVARTLGSRG